MKPTRPTNARSIIECCAEDPVWSRLLPGVERLSRLQTDLLACLPESLRRGIRAASFVDDALTIGTTSAALATKLRQTLPRIQSGLEGRGWKVSAIHLRVQPDDFLYKSNSYKKEPKQAVVSSQAKGSLTDLALSLEEGPLQAAVRRLASR
jgi:hypothetical protein